MYINKKVTRQRILDKIRKTRPHWKVTRVSEAVLHKLDTRIDAMIDRAVHTHPSTGKTFKDFI